MGSNEVGGVRQVGGAYIAGPGWMGLEGPARQVEEEPLSHGGHPTNSRVLG